MIIRKSYRCRIYPTRKQAERLVRWQNALRFLWNIAHEQRLLALARPSGERRYFSAFDQGLQLTELRNDLPWLADVPRSACHSVLSSLDKAWRRCFKKTAGRPRWKSKHDEAFGLCEGHSDEWRLDGQGIRFPKVGTLRAVLHRPVLGKPRSCTIKRDGDQWFASMLYESEVVDPAQRGEPVVAIDRGIAHMLADSDGVLTPNPQFYKRAMKRLAQAQRTVSRRKKGSRNREKAKFRVMRMYRKVRRQREHVLHVESARYAKSHGVVVIENLNVAGMIKGKLSRSIADAGWSSFARMLRYKLEWSGGTLVEVPAAYSSQTCHECGCVDAKSRSGERFVCTGCGHVAHADLNAALILKSRAIRSALPVEGLVPETARRSRKTRDGNGGSTAMSDRGIT